MPRYHNINGNKVQFTAEEEAARDTDYLALSDNTLSEDMKTYRQELRDLPAGKDTVEKCENATWPTKP